MKKFFITLMLLTSGLIYSQYKPMKPGMSTYKVNDTIWIVADISVHPLLDELKEELICYDLPVELMDNINAVYYTPTIKPYAATIMETGEIVISSYSNIYMYPSMFRYVLFHEFGHTIMIQHQDYPYLMRDGNKANIEYALENWSEVKNEFFSYLKKIF